MSEESQLTKIIYNNFEKHSEIVIIYILVLSKILIIVLGFSVYSVFFSKSNVIVEKNSTHNSFSIISKDFRNSGIVKLLQEKKNGNFNFEIFDVKIRKKIEDFKNIVKSTINEFNQNINFISNFFIIFMF
jgi:predicted PurR-regulated permease PerM